MFINIVFDPLSLYTYQKMNVKVSVMREGTVRSMRPIGEMGSSNENGF